MKIGAIFLVGMMIQSGELPLCEVLDSSLIAEAFDEDHVDFGIADEAVFTPAITLWAMVSQFLFQGPGRSCKAAGCRCSLKRPVVSSAKTRGTTGVLERRFQPKRSER